MEDPGCLIEQKKKQLNTGKEVDAFSALAITEKCL